MTPIGLWGARPVLPQVLADGTVTPEDVRTAIAPKKEEILKDAWLAHQFKTLASGGTVSLSVLPERHGEFGSLYSGTATPEGAQALAELFGTVTTAQ